MKCVLSVQHELRLSLMGVWFRDRVWFAFDSVFDCKPLTTLTTLGINYTFRQPYWVWVWCTHTHTHGDTQIWIIIIQIAFDGFMLNEESFNDRPSKLTSHWIEPSSKASYWHYPFHSCSLLFPSRQYSLVVACANFH